uniref:B-cell CLL/lymphoma 7 protein family member A n=1 Tax=Anisakis simplex TaxID=6269 RepID=A0A0M3JJX8_ANISI
LNGSEVATNGTGQESMKKEASETSLANSVASSDSQQPDATPPAAEASSQQAPATDSKPSQKTPQQGSESSDDTLKDEPMDCSMPPSTTVLSAETTKPFGSDSSETSKMEIVTESSGMSSGTSGVEHVSGENGKSEGGSLQPHAAASDGSISESSDTLAGVKSSVTN